MTQEQIPLHQNEEIAPIQGYEGLYSITSFGRVWSHKRVVKGGNNFRRAGGIFLKNVRDKFGYSQVSLYRYSKLKTYTIHVLVAQAFIPNPNKLPMVNHKDGDKLNNFAGTAAKNYEDGNLEWCDYDYNLKHAMENGLKHPNKRSKYHGVSFGLDSNINPWKVQIYKNKYTYIGRYKTEIEAAKAYNSYVLEHSLNRPLNKIK